MGTGLDAESRIHQLNMVRNHNANLLAQKEISDFVKSKDLKAYTDPDNPGATGVTIVDLPDEEAQESLATLSTDDFIYARNEEIHLIQPVVEKQSLKGEEDLEDRDLWHIRRIGLDKLRANGCDLCGRDINIAVLDTGIDSTHPALRDKVLTSFKFGRYGNEVQEESLDFHGHGTHVAGLICGEKVGVAVGAKLHSCVIFPQAGQGTMMELIRALDWVAENPQISIVNMSAGIPGFITAEIMHQAISALTEVGVLTVCAVGNDGRDASCSPGNYSEVMSVGAIDSQNKVCRFSGGGTVLPNYSNPLRSKVNPHIYVIPKVSAPGADIYSCVPQGGYESWSGTSMAAPIVSGIAAMILEKYGPMELLELKEELYERCISIEGIGETRQGYGVVLVDKLLNI